ncbi:MAG: arginine repressor [Ilumatobacteraceae bacterium]|jgi:transcriptional regulator of arginine metabolism|nr:MAG: ArgR family transcriptional regulator [Acidimicrobium sp. BACL27 MAG-120823-bin4]MDA2964440.1 arginine repressor [Actinomycetota bacterium]MDP4635686.1 arginine repressor [Ilumatobacteraceae bacterium]HBZ62971.1 arginine repressor [Acidimicrobium sp.]MDP4694744.1 arginine repressor [Ilumatobacteraceae bacterium]
MSTKVQRQQLIAKIVSSQNVTSQPKLRELLKKKGIKATQATVSRDLEDLGAVKVRTASGETTYAIPEFEPDRLSPPDQLKRVLAEWVADVQYNEPIVVVRTPPGCAHVVASALDRSRLQGLLGTVAGDDTMLCVANSSYSAKRLAKDIKQLAGLEND